MENVQALMNEVYDYWNSQGEHLSKNEVLEHFPLSRHMAVRFGNFNYQTHNGGASQWICNHYMDEDMDALIGFCEQAVSCGIEGFQPLLDAFLDVRDDMKNFEEEIEEECSTCEGTGQIIYDNYNDTPYHDDELEQEFEENGEVSFTCDECEGTGTYTLEQDYPDSVNTLENVLYDIGEEAFFVLVETLIDKQMEQEIEETC